MKTFGKRQVAVYFGSVFLSALGLALVVWVCTSSPSIQPIFAHTELWLKYTYAIKDTINARPTQRQRIIVIGGSSNLFGFNGAMIEANTSYTFSTTAHTAGFLQTTTSTGLCSAQGAGTSSLYR